MERLFFRPPLIDTHQDLRPTSFGLGCHSLYFKARAVTAVGTIAAMLREALAHTEGEPRPGWGGLGRIQWSDKDRSLIIPKAKDSVFHQSSILPSPFSRLHLEEISTCHLRTMTCKQYLENGEWVGVYTLSHRSRYPIEFDPPMQGIRFTATVSEDGGSCDVALHAEGSDGVGQFDLSGDLTSATGKILMIKQYVSVFPGHGVLARWVWSLYMSPFGMVGSWGDDHIGGVGGLVYLWKEIGKE